MLWNWESQRTQYSTVILASLHRWINQTNDHYFVFQIINLWSIGPSKQMIRELSIRLWWSSSWTCKRNTAAVRYKPLSGLQTWSTPFRWFILHSRSKAFLKHFTILIIFQLLLADLPSSAGLLEIAPVYKRQQESWDKVLNRMAAILSYWVSPFRVIFLYQLFQVLRILSHLLLLVTQLAREPVTELPLRYWTIPTLLSSNSLPFMILFTFFIPRKSIHQLVAVMDPRTTQGDSLLHLSVSKSNTLKTQVSKRYAAVDYSKNFKGNTYASFLSTRLSSRTEVRRLIYSHPLQLLSS